MSKNDVGRLSPHKVKLMIFIVVILTSAQLNHFKYIAKWLIKNYVDCFQNIPSHCPKNNFVYAVLGQPSYVTLNL